MEVVLASANGVGQGEVGLDGSRWMGIKGVSPGCTRAERRGLRVARTSATCWKREVARLRSAVEASTGSRSGCDLRDSFGTAKAEKGEKGSAGGSSWARELHVARLPPRGTRPRTYLSVSRLDLIAERDVTM